MGPVAAQPVPVQSWVRWIGGGSLSLGFRTGWFLLSRGALLSVKVITLPIRGPINLIWWLAKPFAMVGSTVVLGGGVWRVMQIPGVSSLIGPIMRSLGFMAQPAVEAVAQQVEKVSPVIADAVDEFAQASFKLVMKGASQFFSEMMNGLERQIIHFVDNLTVENAMGVANASVKVVGRGIKTALFNTSLQTYGAMASTVATLFAYYYGGKIIVEYIDYFARDAKYRIGRPKLMIESHSVAPLDPLKRKISKYLGRYKAPDKDPCLNIDIQKKVALVSKSTENQVKNGANSQWLLLEGPPGTGKTRLAKIMAKNTGFNLITMSGADLKPLIHRNEHLAELQKIFREVQMRKAPTILFIDEVDALGPDRDDPKTSEAQRDILTAFLTQTGGDNKKLMVIGATNRKRAMDSALLSRFDIKAYVAPPDYERRYQILKEYVTPTFRGTPESKGCLNDAGIVRIAAKTAGLTGRDLNKLVTALKSAKAADDGNKLTEERLNEVIYDFLMEARSAPGALRYRVIGVVSDVWYFHLPRLFWNIQELFASMLRRVSKMSQAV